jgi:Sulfatase-modifying factor enzyme 1
MSDVVFKCGQCKEYVRAGGGWAIQKLVDTHIIAGAGEEKPIDVGAVLACREYMDKLPATEEFLQMHRGHTVIFVAMDDTCESEGRKDRPHHYDPVPFKDDMVLIKAGGRFVRSDFIIGRHPVTGGEFQEIVGRLAENLEENSQAKPATWTEAIRYCNLLSLKDERPPAYDEGTGILLDGGGNSARDIVEVKGFRLPTGGEWDYAARGGRPDPPYADWGAVLDRIYWDDPSSHGARPVAPKEPVTNVIGLVGMMGFVREWTTNILHAQECRNRICGWGHYTTNYDCLIAYCVAGETAEEGARYLFRVALSGDRAS